MNNEDSPLDLGERGQCLAMSQFLRSTSRIGLLGLLCVGIGLLAALRMPQVGPWTTGLIWALLLLAAIERVLALRVDFDARLFGALAVGDLGSLRGLDHALAALGLVAPPDSGTGTRDLASRLAGTRRLVMQHAAAVALLAWLAGTLLTRSLP